MQVELSADGVALDSGAKRRRQPEKGRSRISGLAGFTNGSTLLPTGDGNSIWARLMRDVLASLIVHLGGDASETQRMACRRIAALEAELVHLEDGFARVRAAGGEPEAATVDLYQRISNTQRRLCESIGWQRVARDVSDDIQHWAAGKAAEKAARVAVPETSGDGTHASDSPNGSEGQSNAAGLIQPVVAGEPAAAAESNTVVSAGSPVPSDWGGDG